MTLNHLFGLALLVFSCTASLKGQNLFPDPGMEGKLPQFHDNIDVRLCTKEPHAGARCLEFSGREERMLHSTWKHMIPVKPNTIYTFSAWLKTRHGTGRVGLFLHDQNRKYIGDNNIWPPALSGNRDWTHVRIVFNSRNAHFLQPTAGVMGTSAKLWVDDCELKEGIMGNSENLLRNSAFKQCATPGYPDFWGLGPECALTGQDWETGNYFGTTPDVPPPVPGAQVLFMKAPAAKRLMPMHLAVAPNVQMTFSVYLKADRDMAQVFIHGKRVTVGREWQRVERQFKHRGQHKLLLSISCREKQGKLFLAAPMLEYGEAATPWKEAAVDLAKNESAEPPPNTKTVDLPLLTTPPRLDGQINPDEWREAWQTADFKDNSRGTTGPGTKAYIACDRQNLYLAFYCRQRGPKLTPQDVGWARFSGDSVEFFFQAGKGAMRHIAVNPWGEVFAESGEARKMSPWPLKLETAVKRNQNGWQVECAIPFHAMQPLAPQAWAFNLCRNLRNLSGDTYHLAAGGKDSYHCTERFIKVRKVPVRFSPIHMTAPGLIGQSLFCVVRFGQPDHRKYQVELTYDRETRRTEILAEAGEIPVLFDRVTPQSPETVATLNLLSSTGKKCFTLQTKALHLTDKNPTSPLHIYGKYNWFTDQDPSIPLRITSQLPGPQKIRLFRNGTLYRELDVTGPDTLNLSLKPQDLANNMIIHAELYQQGKLKARAAETLRILPRPNRRTTRVNRFIRALEYDGKPILPLIFHPYPTRITPDWVYDFVKKDHFNTIELILPPELGKRSKLEQIHHHLRETKDKGMPVVARINTRMTKTPAGQQESFADFLAIRKDIITEVVKHDHVLALYLMDEPTPAFWEGKRHFRETDLLVLSREAQAIDPYVPLTINYNQFKPMAHVYGSFNALDFCYMDSYPFLTSNPSVPNPCAIFARDAWNLNRSLETFGMPAFFWLATYSYGDTIRMPTPEELKNQIYIALIHGTRGIEYFTDYPVSVPLIHCIRKVQKDVQDIAPILLQERARISSHREGFLHYALIELDGTRYLMAANTSSDDTFTLTLEDANPLKMKPLEAAFYCLKGKNWTHWKGRK